MKLLISHLFGSLGIRKRPPESVSTFSRERIDFLFYCVGSNATLMAALIALGDFLFEFGARRNWPRWNWTGDLRWQPKCRSREYFTTIRRRLDLTVILKFVTKYVPEKKTEWLENISLDDKGTQIFIRNHYFNIRNSHISALWSQHHRRKQIIQQSHKFFKFK